ncbi:MAG TPA: cyanophycinase [Planctomycetaceae bacterium]|nr:cyanophycinase [Planctomycetaceae bacterium]
MRRSIFGFALCAVVSFFAPTGIEDDDDDTTTVRFLQSANGTLVICGGGEVSDDIMLQFVEAAGGEDARVVVITTASETADTDEIEEDLEFWRELKLERLTVLNAHSRDTANDPEFIRPLEDASGIWFIGGKQARLADTYVGTASEQKIHAVLQRGGVVGGISAGAAVMSSVMIRDGETEPQMGRGFGLLPGMIVDQHFLARSRQQRLMGALAAHPGMVGIGIDEGAAVVVHGRRMTVVGNSDVVACISPSSGRGAKVETLKPGSQADLVALSLAATKTRRAPLTLRHAITDAVGD